MAKITKRVLEYPLGYEPNIIKPNEYQPHRFILGKTGKNPLVVIGMNPSAASEKYSDATVNRVIRTAIKLGYDGWYVINLYPERATNAADLLPYDQALVNDNINHILELLSQLNITDVWGAWGNTEHHQLKTAKTQLLNALKRQQIKIFAFGINQDGNPKHPLYLKIDEKNKYYLSY